MAIDENESLSEGEMKKKKYSVFETIRRETIFGLSNRNSKFGQ